MILGKVMFSVLSVCLSTGGFPCDHYPWWRWLAMADLRGTPPITKNFLSVMQFFVKFGKIICWRPQSVGVRSYRECWNPPVSHRSHWTDPSCKWPIPSLLYHIGKPKSSLYIYWQAFSWPSCHQSNHWSLIFPLTTQLAFRIFFSKDVDTSWQLIFKFLPISKNIIYPSSILHIDIFFHFRISYSDQFIFYGFAYSLTLLNTMAWSSGIERY